MPFWLTINFHSKSFESNTYYSAVEMVFVYRIPHPSTLWFHPTSVISQLEKSTLGHYHDFNFLNYRNFLFTIDSPCFNAWCNIRSDVTWKSMDEVPIVPLHLPRNFMSQNDSTEIKYKMYFRRNQLSCRIICLWSSVPLFQREISSFSISFHCMYHERLRISLIVYISSVFSWWPI